MAVTIQAEVSSLVDITTLLEALSKLKPDMKVSELGSINPKEATALIKEYSNKSEEEQKSKNFIKVFKKMLSNHIKGGSLFIETLNTCRIEGTDYSRLRPIYRDLVGKKDLNDWYKRRQLLLMTSAIWRYTFNGENSAIKCYIDAERECGDCGAYVQGLISELKKMKLIR